MSNNAISMGAKGYYSLSVLDSFGKVKKTKSAGNTANVVTYVGAYQALISSSIFSFTYAAVGTGTTEITRSSTALGAEGSGGRTGGVSASRGNSEVDNLDGTSTLTLTRNLSFSLGSQVGTFSEVGLYSSSSGGVFIAGQLIKDEFGAPTTITILSDEQLIVTYTIEWTVPNTSNLAGTGTVTDAASNTYNYEIWAQPYFSEYVVGDTDDSKRYFNSYDELSFREANGTSDYGIGIDSNGGWSVSHNGSGVVTANAGSKTYSPTEMVFTDCVYIGFYFFDGSNVRADIADTALNLAAVSVNADGPAVFIKFLDPLSKDNTESFDIGLSITLNI